MKLPFVISVPHAGLTVPPEAAPHCILTEQDIRADSDEGAGEIYAIEDEVQAFVTTDIARAIVDLNRAVDDRRADGVVKTHTCWQVPVYREPLPEDLVQELLDKYYHPYHRRLTELADDVVMGIDCHTMAAHGPPIGPDPGIERPWICLGNADGTCPHDWLESLRDCLRQTFGGGVSLNKPFSGGYIVRAHQAELPWVQMEFSRAPFLSNEEKRRRFLEAVKLWLALRP